MLQPFDNSVLVVSSCFKLRVWKYIITKVNSQNFSHFLQHTFEAKFEQGVSNQKQTELPLDLQQCLTNSLMKFQINQGAVEVLLEPRPRGRDS